MAEIWEEKQNDLLVPIKHSSKELFWRTSVISAGFQDTFNNTTQNETSLFISPCHFTLIRAFFCFPSLGQDNSLSPRSTSRQKGGIFQARQPNTMQAGKKTPTFLLHPSSHSVKRICSPMLTGAVSDVSYGCQLPVMGSPRPKLCEPWLQFTQAGETAMPVLHQTGRFSPPHLFNKSTVWPLLRSAGSTAQQDCPLEGAGTHLSPASAHWLCSCGRTQSSNSPKPGARPLQMPANNIKGKESMQIPTLNCTQWRWFLKRRRLEVNIPQKQKNEIQVEGKATQNSNCSLHPAATRFVKGKVWTVTKGSLAQLH